MLWYMEATDQVMPDFSPRCRRIQITSLRLIRHPTEELGCALSIFVDGIRACDG